MVVATEAPRLARRWAVRAAGSDRHWWHACVQRLPHPRRRRPAEAHTLAAKVALVAVALCAATLAAHGTVVASEGASRAASSSLLSYGAPHVGQAVVNASLGPAVIVGSADDCADHCTAFADHGCIAFTVTNTSAPAAGSATGTQLQCTLSGWNSKYAVAEDPASSYWFSAPPAASNTSAVGRAVAYALDVPLRGVTLTGGILSSAFHRNLAYLSQFPVSDLLFWFRKRAGVKDPPGGNWGWDADGPDKPMGLKGSVAGAFLMGAGGAVRWNVTAGDDRTFDAVGDRSSAHPHDNERRAELEHAARPGTGDEARAQALLRSLSSTMEAVVAGIQASVDNATGYAMAFPANESHYRENPDYVTSWVTHGLLAAADAGNTNALSILRRHFDWFNTADALPQFLPPLSGPEETEGPFTDRKSAQFEYGHLVYLIYQGLPHRTQMALSSAGTQADVWVASQLYAERWWLKQLAARNVSAIWERAPYPHNYELTAIGAYMDLYIITGEPLYLAAVDGFYAMFQQAFTHVGGSVAIKEWKLYPPMSYYLDCTGEDAHSAECHSTGELCGQAFQIKLSQRLHRLRPWQESYAGDVERTLLNGVVSQITTDGRAIRQFAILHKVKMPATNISTCCEGQGTRILGALPELLYSTAASGNGSLHVNLYAASTIVWQLPGPSSSSSPRVATLTTETDLPYGSGEVTLTVDLAATAVSATAQLFDLNLRIPGWISTPSVVVTVTSTPDGVRNSTAAALLGQGGADTYDTYAGVRGSYLSLRREWRGGDIVSVSLPRGFRVTPYGGLTQIQPFKRYAIEVGPVLLAAVSTSWDNATGCVHVRGVNASAPETWLVPVNSTSGQRRDSNSDAGSGLAASASPRGGAVGGAAPAGGSLHFRVAGAGNEGLEFMPYFEVQDQWFDTHACYDT